MMVAIRGRCYDEYEPLIYLLPRANVLYSMFVSSSPITARSGFQRYYKQLRSLIHRPNTSRETLQFSAKCLQKKLLGVRM
eukprot:scaffold11070_cov67-Skeletonema_marinoi.AAC.2